MKRRTACSALALLAVPCVLGAQGSVRKARIGLLGEPPFDEVMQRAAIEPFRRGLRELGYVEGHNLVLELRSAEGRNDRLKPLMDELLQLQLDVLVTAFPAAAMVARAATRTLPVVAASVDRPVEMGLAATLARPGGNITGISAWGGEVVAKRLQLVRELVPSARNVAILANPHAIPRATLDKDILSWQGSLGVRIRVYEAATADDFEGAFAAMARAGTGAVVVLADANTYTHRVRLNELCLQRRMPSVWGGREFLTGGGLASYQSDFPAMFARAAVLVDYIVKGQKPAEIPFEQATRLEMVIDRRAARALGITVPRATLLAANEVIE